MKVLVTGGYGFIGSYVAETFYNHGHDVHIMDNLSTGDKNNVKFKHQFHNMSIESPSCDHVFREEQFDVVIHLAAQVNVSESIDHPQMDAKTNVFGLANILGLAKKYHVKKVVFASTAAVYGDNQNLPINELEICNPLSPYGINKYIGEIYCQKWTELFNLDTLCLRFSNVYGPKQSNIGEGGVISVFIRKILQRERLPVFGDGEQTRDFIFVQDVADALYLGVQYDLSGVYNLSNNTRHSINDLIYELDRISLIKGVDHYESRPGDINHSQLDNTQLRQALHWKPERDLRFGLKLTFQWFHQYGDSLELIGRSNKIS
ncbi:NAD-dependent epimerase/dehydratase family protein [Filobacillus milosensis]|uniref:NAD-dependent epimerase/dehydratase family protein n=1 Tax=Filobacillus milosensis TaxID=94137 RepID=A0A4Y8IHS3_9BACI|nr:NAD-dependent epimerase/dehydratase family protein [Filobacillus milosensis]TFB18914.1 NAD-dependent epimerase/dehydratase family protein [Filobacillus milosensis]